MSAVWIRRCASLEEALVVNALLKARGFHSELANYHYASIDWSLIPALGGVQIMVPASEFEAAKATLIEAAESGQAELEVQFGSYDHTMSRRRWRAWSMVAIWFDLLVLGLFVVMEMVGAFERRTAKGEDIKQ